MLRSHKLLCYNLTMQPKNKTNGQKSASFIEAARREQILECAIQTIAELGYNRASLARIAARAGISKGVISYYFNSKEALVNQVVNEISSASARVVTPQIAEQTTAALGLKAYIRSAIEYIGNHRTEMIALNEIMTQYRTPDGKAPSGAANEELALADLETLLRKGQEEGEFRQFALRPMAVTIRRAIDAVTTLFAADPDLNVISYALEIVTLFDLATRKEQDLRR